MIDNDLIRRGDVLKDLFELLADSGWYSRTRHCINKVPAASHEMTAREYLVTEARMCNHYGLPSVFDVSGQTVDEAIEMVERFAREHPEEANE